MVGKVLWEEEDSSVVLSVSTSSIFHVPIAQSRVLLFYDDWKKNL